MTFTLTCMAAELARAVSLATQVSGNAKQLNILKSCMIEVSNGSATIAATDMDHAVRVTLAGDGEGRVFIDTLMLAQKSAALRPNIPVIISGDDPNFVMMVQGKTKWKIPLVSEAEHKQFPFEITQEIEGDAVDISASAFSVALDSAGCIVRDGEASVINMGVFLDMSDGFRIVGCDRAALSAYELDANPLGASVVLPNRAVAVIGNIFRSAETIRIVATSDAVSIASDGVMYRTKLVDIPYMDWRKAFDAQTKAINGSVLVDADDLTQSVKRATAIAEERGKDGISLSVNIVFADGECSATAKNRNGEEGVDYCPADGDPGSFRVTASLFIAALASFSTERVKISLVTGDPDAVMNAIKVEAYPETPNQNVRVIMPRRV